MQTPDNADAIIAYLAAQGATTFSRLLYNIPKLHKALKDPQLSIILAPNDSALQRLSAATGKSLAELQQDIYGIDILANHISTKPTQKTIAMVISINGNTYGASERDIQGLKVSAFTKIGSTAVLVIGEIIIYPNQVEKASLNRDLGVLKPLQQNDMMFILIQKGDIKGKDLISLCVSDPEVNKLCNAKLDFKYLLKRDYNATAPQGVNPREHYVKLSTGFKAWTTLVPKPIPIYRNMDNTLELSFIKNLQPIDSQVGFVAISSSGHQSLYLTDDGTIYEIKRSAPTGQMTFHNANGSTHTIGQPSIYQTGNHLIPTKLEGLPKIVRIKSGESLTVMMDIDEHLWVYGQFKDIYVLNRHFTVPDAAQPLGRALENLAGVEYIKMTQTIQRPTRLDWGDRFLRRKIFDIAVSAWHGSNSLLIILENDKPRLYGDPSVTSVSIESITKSNIIVNTTFGGAPSRRQLLDSVPILGNWQFISSVVMGLPITEVDVVKVEGHFILDNQGRLWPDYIWPGAPIKVQIVYPPEPDLRFVDVADGHQGITWAFSEDGQLFAIAVSLAPFLGNPQLSREHLTPIPGINGIVSMDINPGAYSNAAFLTRWD
jgi:hypothetical protein